MPNHVTNRLEINADRETVQKVMNFLKGKTDDDNTPCYIDFNNIIPMPEELLIEKSSSGDLGMKYLEAMQLKPFYFLLDDDALRTIQWIEGLAERTEKKRCNLEHRIWKIGKSTVIPLGTSGLPPHGVQNGMPITKTLKSRTYFGSIRHGMECHCLSKNFPRYFRMWNSITPMRTKT